MWRSAHRDSQATYFRLLSRQCSASIDSDCFVEDRIMKKNTRTQILDKLHIWSVRALMGLTLVGCATLTMQVYTYYNYIRPQRLEERRQAKELEIAMEQEERESELRRRQKDAETLVG